MFSPRTNFLAVEKWREGREGTGGTGLALASAVMRWGSGTEQQKSGTRGLRGYKSLSVSTEGPKSTPGLKGQS